MLPPDRGHPLPGWMPVRWSWSGGQPRLDWCELGDLRLVAPFFSETTRLAQDRFPGTRQTSVDLLAQIPAVGPGARPSGFIFHLSRCGSTLAAQALAALPRNIVLSEPETLDTVLRTRVTLPGSSDAMRTASMQGLARAYGWPRFPEEDRFFIKFDPWHIFSFDLIRQAFPDTPWIFLYRDPVEVLVSQNTERSGRMLPGPVSVALLEVPLLAALQMSPDEFCARALGRMASAAIDAVRRDPLGRLVNYTQLPEAIETVLAPWFGLALSESDTHGMRATHRFHAKRPGQPFVSDHLGKQRSATDDLRKLADVWIRPAFVQLEELRGMQEAGGLST